MTRRPLTWAVLALTLLVAGYVLGRPWLGAMACRPHYADLMALDPRNAAADAQAALGKADPRLITVNGYARYPPGVPNDWEALTAVVGERNLRNTTDVMSCEAHGRYIDRATHYAELYNAVVLTGLRRSPDPRIQSALRKQEAPIR